MQLFLENKEPIGFSEVIHYCNDVKHLNWAATTLHTYLTRLIAKGVLCSDRNGYKRSYYADVSEKQLSHQWAQKIVKRSFGGSIRNFLVSLTYEAPLSKEEVTELHQLLEDQLIRKRRTHETAVNAFIFCIFIRHASIYHLPDSWSCFSR